MKDTVIDLLWYFLIYACAGWYLEVIFTVCKQKKLINKGFLNGPMCPTYGVCAVFITILFHELRDQVVFLFVGSMVVSTFIEFVTGHILHGIFHQKWWDYSDRRCNADGYICLRFSIYWGIFGSCVILFLNPFIKGLTGLIPDLIAICIELGLLALMVCDMLGTVFVLLRLQRSPGKIEQINQNLEHVSIQLRRRVTIWVERRMIRAYPQMKTAKKLEKKKSTVFAEGNSFYKHVVLFFLTAFLGDVIETIFMYITRGHIVSRSSVVYGHFSIVWGLAVVIMTASMYRYRNRNLFSIFMIGTVLGGTYEYACSVFTELVFGQIFWDYSKIPFNLAGRINLLFCFFWGAVAVLWLKYAFPFLSKWIEKIPAVIGKPVCIVMLIFMTYNCLISAGALARYTARHEGNAADTKIEQFFDTHFPDSRMEKVYPYAKIVKKG